MADDETQKEAKEYLRLAAEAGEALCRVDTLPPSTEVATADGEAARKKYATHAYRLSIGLAEYEELSDR